MTKPDPVQDERVVVERCSDCSGDGIVIGFTQQKGASDVWVEGSDPRQYAIQEPCPTCDGTGKAS